MLVIDKYEIEKDSMDVRLLKFYVGGLEKSHREYDI